MIYEYLKYSNNTHYELAFKAQYSPHQVFCNIPKYRPTVHVTVML